MFKVKIKASGEVVTVYAVNDMKFLVYYKTEGKWAWEENKLFIPYEPEKK